MFAHNAGRPRRDLAASYRHVLAIYDGSEESEKVLDMVCRTVRPHRGRLTILILRPLPFTKELPVYEEGADPEVDAIVKRAEELAEARGLKAATAVRYARALGPAVVSEARLHGVDLVALSLPGPDRLGSEGASHTDVDTILSQVNCAVMLCRPPRQGAGG